MKNTIQILSVCGALALITLPVSAGGPPHHNEGVGLATDIVRLVKTIISPPPAVVVTSPVMTAPAPVVVTPPVVTAPAPVVVTPPVWTPAPVVVTPPSWTPPPPAAFSRAGSRAPRTTPRPKRRRQRRTPLTCVKQPRIAESGVFVFFPGKSAGHSGTAEVH